MPIIGTREGNFEICRPIMVLLFLYPWYTLLLLLLLFVILFLFFLCPWD